MLIKLVNPNGTPYKSIDRNVVVRGNAIVEVEPTDDIIRKIAGGKLALGGPNDQAQPNTLEAVRKPRITPYIPSWMQNKIDAKAAREALENKANSKKKGGTSTNAG